MSKIHIANNYQILCGEVAHEIAELVRRKPNAVLGLATGSTPVGVYELLVEWHKRNGLDFSRVTCFNLDEYYSVSPSSPRSYRHFMVTKLFNHINCRVWFVPNGRQRSRGEIKADCGYYEKLISKSGGIDLQLVGIGRNGHMGFNEPGSPFNSCTRLVNLSNSTRQDAAAEFDGLDHVPRKAITMGLQTIMGAARIIFMAAGEKKTSIVQKTLTTSPTVYIPATLLADHPNVAYYLDEAATPQFLQPVRPSEQLSSSGFKGIEKVGLA